MASVTVETRNGRTLYRIEYRDKDKRRRKVRLGAIAKRDAQAIASKVDSLCSAAIAGNDPPTATAQWLAEIGDDLHGKLAEQGLCKPRTNFTLEAWLEHFLARHKVGDYGRRNLERTKACLIEHFTGEKPLKDITSDDAQAYREWLEGKGLAQATIAQRIKKARQFFTAAVDAGAIAKSPFAKVLAGTMANAERSIYVPASDIEKAIAMAPDAQWRLIIALSRYAGLRSPSEVLALRWADVDFTAGTLTVHATKTAKQGKTKRRVVPILPELRPHLEAAFDPEDERCISRYQTSNLNLRKVFLEILAKAKLKPWPRLFHNLRGSLQTDLADRFPLHVVTSWLGNSERVAEAHYLKTTGGHLAAAQGVGQQVGHSLAESTPKQRKALSENSTKTKATAKTQCSAMAIGTPTGTRTQD